MLGVVTVDDLLMLDVVSVYEWSNVVGGFSGLWQRTVVCDVPTGHEEPKERQSMTEKLHSPLFRDYFPLHLGSCAITIRTINSPSESDIYQSLHVA